MGSPLRAKPILSVIDDFIDFKVFLKLHIYGLFHEISKRLVGSYLVGSSFHLCATFHEDVKVSVL